MRAAASGRIWLALLGWLIVGAFALWAVTVLLILYTGSRPVLRKADAILVLGAAQYNGRPSPVLKARLDHALDLYHDTLAAWLVFTGGVGAGDTLSEGEVARRYALRHDVPASAILVERHGLTSAESVAAAASLMRAKGLRSALIVSDSYHMLRLELLARRAGIRPYRAPASSPIDRARRQRVRYVLRESMVFPATVLLGGK
ncbi:MAG TPA: YdcF family protein [Longimicrobiales bacterium]|nr:YdcF family protein [Longimicrobiales bacterium]